MDTNSFDIDAINNMSVGIPAPDHGNSADTDEFNYITSVDGLSRDQCIKLWKSFERPVCVETNFILNTFLAQADVKETESVLTLFGHFLKGMAESRDSKTPETIASWGIYLSMILRYNPSLDFYVAGTHFLIHALNAYYPYVTMFTTYFLIPIVHKGINLELPYKGSSGSTSPVRARPNLDHITRMSPTNAKKFEAKNESHERLRGRVGSLPRLITNTEDTETDTPQISVINKIMDACPLNSPERKLLSELRRLRGSTSAYLMSRLGLKFQKQELAILLDDVSLLEDPLTDDDIQKAIFMHSNKVLAMDDGGDSIFLPHHFDRAIQCLNLDIGKLTFHLSDWVLESTLDELFFMSKELKHAQCLEILKLVVQKNISICSHKLKKLPESWREPLLGLYTTPRWRLSMNNPMASTPGHIFGATLEYYRVNLCSNEPREEFLATLESLSSKLRDPEDLENFLTNLKNMNKSHYVISVSSYVDFLSENKTVFANIQDTMLNDVFELSRNFVFPCREGNKIFLFDYNTAATIIEKGENIYNRCPIDPHVLDQITKSYQSFNKLGLSTSCFPMTEFLHELIHGRELAEGCTCRSNKNYVKKLTRVLRQYNVKEDSFEVINLADILFKFSLITINLKADSIPQLCSKLYQMIKLADPMNREALKRTVSSLILIYSRVGGEYIVNI